MSRPSSDTPRPARFAHPPLWAGGPLDVAQMLAVGGEMASRIAAFDWRATPFGPLERWPVSLRTSVAMVLENRFPMTLLWGPNLLGIHNDAYIPVLGSKHPASLGRPTAEVWSEIW